MRYWDNVGRSFSIAWRNRYLWLLALFAGESGGGFNASYNQGTRSTGRTGDQSAAAQQAAQQAAQWIGDHAGLLLALAILWLILAIGFFILAAVCEGGLIRGAAEHDAERPFGLREAWTMGVHTMWVIVRFRLLLVALGLPAVVIVIGVIVGGVIAAFANQGTLAVVLISLGVLLGLALIVYLIYLSFLDRFGARAAILEERGAVASLARAHRLLFKRLGRSLVVWLVSIAVAIGTGIAVAIVAAILVIPLLAMIYIAASGGLSWLWVGVLALVGIPVLLVVGAFINAQSSTYWTVSFRRMEIDYPPAYGYPAAPPPPTTS